MDDGDRADLIYHESQTAALCGVHAVNTLLQAPNFSEVELAQIAHELDAAEHELMASAGVDSAEYAAYVAEGSGNVAEHGMFSIQVLSKALEIFGLQAIPYLSSDPAAVEARRDPTAQQAFICNLEEHWFTVRAIHGCWWDLNSLFPAPKPLSPFHLSAYLDSLRDQGYTIFVVAGPLPPPHPPATEAERFVPGQPGRWFTPEEAKQATQETEELKRQGFQQAVTKGVLGKAAGGQGTWVTLSRPGAKRAHDDGNGGAQGDDPELVAALAASLAEADAPRGGRGGGAWGRAAAAGSGWGGGGGRGHGDDDADLAAAIAASLADHAGPSGGQQQQEQQPGGVVAAGQQGQGRLSFDLAGSGDDIDPELAAAIAASMEQQPAAAVAAARGGQAAGQEGTVAAAAEAEAAEAQPELSELGPEPEAGEEGAIEVGLRLPSGGRASRRFSREGATVGHLAAFAAQQGAAMGRHQLTLPFPRRVLADWGQSLAAAGVVHKDLVSVEPK